MWCLSHLTLSVFISAMISTLGDQDSPAVAKNENELKCITESVYLPQEVKGDVVSVSGG